MSRSLDGSVSGLTPSGFAYDFKDETTALAAVKRINPAYDNDCDLGTVAKRFKNVQCVTINGGTAPSSFAFLPLDGSSPMTGNINMNSHAITNITNLTPSGATSDIGSAISPFRDLYLSGTFNGSAGVRVGGVQDQTYGIAPAGQRDTWQYSTGNIAGIGGLLHYAETADVLLSSDASWVATGGRYSVDGGATFSACTYDVPAVSTHLFGSNGSNLFTAVPINLTTDFYTSTDGKSYTQHAGSALPAGSTYSSNVIWYNNMFIMGANVGVATEWIYTSTDGFTWTARTTPAMTGGVDYWSFAASPSVVVVVTGDPAVNALYSANGTTWAAASGLSVTTASVVYSSALGEFVALALNGDVYTSSNGATWSASGGTGPSSCMGLIWVNEINRFYAARVSANGNYSLWSTPAPGISFEDTELDGAGVDAQNYSMVVYIPAHSRFVVGTATNGTAYSTARPLDLKMLSDDIRVRNHPVDVGLYSLYADTTCINTAVETNMSTSASSIGSLFLQASQPLGMVLVFNLTFLVTSLGGDTVSIRFKVNGSTILTHSPTFGAGTANAVLSYTTLMTVRGSSTMQIVSTEILGTTMGTAVSTPAYTRTQGNTWSITAQWGVNASSLTLKQFVMRAVFPNGP